MQQLQNAAHSNHTQGCSDEIRELIGNCIMVPQLVGDQLAWVDSDGSWTHSRLSEVTSDIESWLLYLGICSGDRVMIVSANCRAFVAFLLALVRLDVSPVLVDANLPAQQVDQLRAECKPRTVFYMISASQPAKWHAIRHEAEFINPVEWGPVAFSELNNSAKHEF